MERLDGAGLQEVPEEARNLTSRAACCQSAIRRVESPLCCSHARQSLTSRHGVTPKRVNRVNPVTTRMPSNIRTTVPKTTVRGSRGESTCCAKRSKRKKTARSYAALRRAVLLPPQLAVHIISVRVAIVTETSKETAPATDATHRLPTRWTFRYDMMCTD